MRDPHRRPGMLLHLGLGAGVLAVGALEAGYGRPQLFGDDIAYLDVANMIRLGDWRAALNPLWSLGYPLLLSLVKRIFSNSIRGELAAVFALNFTIYLACWISFVWLLNTVHAFLGRHAERGERPAPFVMIAAAWAFVTGQICLGRVSSIGPDQLVTCLFFVASALVLRFLMQPSARTGALLGLTLGAGYVVKAVFLPLSVILLAIALLSRGRRAVAPRVALAAPAALLLLSIPYAAGLSWAFGRITLGEAGPLNYAFHVNQLPHWMGWQGGPGGLGTPIHPVILLRQHPAVFAFGEPFHVTYPPQYNMPYWYDGYRHFFSPVNAARAIFTNLREFERVMHENWPFAFALLLAIAVLWARRTREGSLFELFKTSWPVWLPSILGIVLYLQVHLEGRYVAGFVTMLAVLPFLAVRSPAPRFVWAAVLILAAGTGLNLSLRFDQTVHRALHPDLGDEQWMIAQYLEQSGLQPGDRVASVSTDNDIRCTWAYAARLRIVAAIGNDAYDPDPPAPMEDFNLFWTDAEVQNDVLNLFRQQGAKAVIIPRASSKSDPLNSSWQRIPGTQAWLLRL